MGFGCRWVDERNRKAGMTFRVMDKIQVGARSAPTLFSASDSEADGVPPLPGLLEAFVQIEFGHPYLHTR